jgi:hypothetical protein
MLGGICWLSFPIIPYPTELVEMGIMNMAKNLACFRLSAINNLLAYDLWPERSFTTPWMKLAILRQRSYPCQCCYAKHGQDAHATHSGNCKLIADCRMSRLSLFVAGRSHGVWSWSCRIWKGRNSAGRGVRFTRSK